MRIFRNRFFPFLASVHYLRIHYQLAISNLQSFIQISVFQHQIRIIRYHPYSRINRSQSDSDTNWSHRYHTNDIFNYYIFLICYVLLLNEIGCFFYHFFDFIKPTDIEWKFVGWINDIYHLLSRYFLLVQPNLRFILGKSKIIIINIMKLAFLFQIK